jgi:hypothetical protein
MFGIVRRVLWTENQPITRNVSTEDSIIGKREDAAYVNARSVKR